MNINRQKQPMKLNWIKCQPVPEGEVFWTVSIEGFRYWVREHGGKWSIEDCCGAVYGAYATADDGMEYVNNLYK